MLDDKPWQSRVMSARSPELTKILSDGRVMESDRASLGTGLFGTWVDNPHR